MVYIDLKYTANLNRTIPVIAEQSPLVFGDSQAHRITVSRADGAFSGSVTADFINSAGNAVTFSGSIDNGCAVCVLPQWCYSLPGAFALLMRVTNGTQTTTVLNLRGVVGESYTSLGNVPSATETTITIEQLVAQINGKSDSNHVHSWGDIQGKPDIPEAYDDTALAGRVTALETNKANSNHTHSYNDLTDTPEAYDDTEIRQQLIDNTIVITSVDLSNGTAWNNRYIKAGDTEGSKIVGNSAGMIGRSFAVVPNATYVAERQDADDKPFGVCFFSGGVNGEVVENKNGKTLTYIDVTAPSTADTVCLYSKTSMDEISFSYRQPVNTVVSGKQDALTESDKNSIVKSALTSANRITGLTDEEKVNACGVIGAVKQKTATKTTYTLTESQNYVEINIPDGVSFINVLGRNSASSSGFTITYKMTIDGTEKAIIAMANGTSTADGYFNVCLENKYGYIFGYGITNYGNATAARKSTEMTASLNGLYPWHVTKLKIQVSNGSSYAGTTFDVFMA